MSEIGNRGYEAEADALAVRHESISFEAAHAHLIAMLPPMPVAVIDIGVSDADDGLSLQPGVTWDRLVFRRRTSGIAPPAAL